MQNAQRSLLLVVVVSWATMVVMQSAASQEVQGGAPVWRDVRFPSSWRLWPGSNVAVSPSKVGTTYYVDARNGNDRNSGISLSTALRTLGAAATRVQAGDTVLIRKGLYRGGLPWFTTSGAPGKPITFGSYGDGEVIVDGSPQLPSPWVPYSGTTWKITNPGYTPVAVVVNSVPLREINHGQTRAIPASPHPWIPRSNSGGWYYDTATGTLYADFGSVLGNNGNPNSADVIVPRNGRVDQGNFSSTITYQANYLTFAGLTIRGGTYNGISGGGSHITIVDCKIVFNTRAGISIGPPYPSSGTGSVGDQVLYNLVHDNVLENWPRGNNGYYSWGGWPGHVVAYQCYQCLFQGNIVYHGGGEGILNYGSQSGITVGSNVVRQNVVYDNWSVEIYFDNQPNDTAEENFVFSHPKATVQGDLLGYWDKGVRLLNAVGISMADETNSNRDGLTELANTAVINNIIVNSSIAIGDGCDGARACSTHALINTNISNNTIILPPYAYADSAAYGLRIHEILAKNRGSHIERNLVCGDGDSGNVLFFYDDQKIRFRILSFLGNPQPKMSGISSDLNRYSLSSGTRAFVYGSGRAIDLSVWRMRTGQDRHSAFSSSEYCPSHMHTITEGSVPVYKPTDFFRKGKINNRAGANW